MKTPSSYVITAVLAATAGLMLAPSAVRAAEAEVDYHVAAPGPDVQPYIVPAASEPLLDEAARWELLRRKVRYVFVLYQENRSFDHYFGTFPGADGIFSRPSAATPGFHQPFLGPDGTERTIQPFRIGAAEYAADLDDPDHSHAALVAKMNVQGETPRMDRFAAYEERKYSPHGNPSRAAVQSGQLAMAYVDGDTIPLLWRFADRFVLYDHIFQLMTGPSTPGNLSIIAAQSGVTQWLLHPDQAVNFAKLKSPGVPVLEDPMPFWGSPLDRSPDKLPFGPRDSKNNPVERNLTFASIPLTLRGGDVAKTTDEDEDPDDDLADVREDIRAISARRGSPIGFGWYQEAYGDKPADPDDGPTDADGKHAAYITHHNGPQYFGYIANNPKMRRDLHGLDAFFHDLKTHALPASGGVFYVKGGYRNPFGLKPANPDPIVQKNFVGDDDHAKYSDSQISEILVAKAINAIAASPYWDQCAIIVTWDDSGGFYDHVPPPIHSRLPNGTVLSDGPRVPLLLISPFARTHTVQHETGDHASVVKFVDRLFDLIPLAELPNEKHARDIGRERYGQANLGPADALTPDVTDLSGGFDPARLSGRVPPLPRDYATIPETLLRALPPTTGYGCKALGIVPVDRLLRVENVVPPDFNPRPHTCPSKSAE
ncbi:MAG TPA: alkaline phosphatase family protein [Opitutaceae bacterium]|nr:alkaline phosphatase family protein [Opitutaceae bacterium]